MVSRIVAVHYEDGDKEMSTRAFFSHWQRKPENLRTRDTLSNGQLFYTRLICASIAFLVLTALFPISSTARAAARSSAPVALSAASTHSPFGPNVYIFTPSTP